MSDDAQDIRRRSLQLTGVSVKRPGMKGLVEGGYYSALSRWRLSRPDLLGETVLVSGSPRSGTTWFEEMLVATLQRMRIYEPTSNRKLPKWRSAFGLVARPYRDPDVEDPLFADALARLLSGSHLGTAIVRRDWATTRALWARQPPVTKVVNLNLLMPWMARSIPDLKAVQIVRNPLATISSQMKYEGTYWQTATELSEPYRQFLDAQPQLPSPGPLNHVEEVLAAMWACEHRWLSDNADRMPGVAWLRYEDLVRDPEGEVRRVCAEMGVALPEVIAPSVFRRPSRSVQPGSAAIESGDGVGGFRSSLDPAQIERATDVLARFGFPFYPDPDRT